MIKILGFAKKIRLVLTPDWVKLLILKEDVAEFLEELKEKDFRIYILSNLSRESYEYIKKYDFWQKVDGSIFSFEEKMCKPERKIYETLIQKYNLIPEETIFVDDMKENIDVAESLKMNGIVFQNLKQVEMEIETYLSLDR